jgi:ribosomal protein L37AE/L43A
MAKSKRKITYETNKKAKVGDEIVCPICSQKFVKRQYSQAFCCGSCKDAFWNAKGDRHSAGYYEKYDNKHPGRKLRRALYSMNVVNARDSEELEARMALVTDEGFRRYVNDDCDVCDIPNCNVDLATMYKNYLCVD